MNGIYTADDICYLRIKKGLSKSMLAEICGVTLTYISLIEKGAVKPTEYMVKNILSMLQ